MQQEPLFITDVTIGGEIHKAKIFGNVDKTTNFIYYTFQLSDGRRIMISKFDGDKWLITNTNDGTDDLAEQLGKLIDTE
ncbi:hypothetical protein E6C50_09340 [Flavobacterium supellecticarium]|uniref:Uncharacterized protein n=1 Tax=Flavobacterium supellecticarium TaxID=2565924 RepID=A0A4S3ZXU8_9FLAO|nr:hypothetical protein [Flavobacterium supellecticarium]THF50423.1 hypothetical protein E6C50_09340 [Flavobacterium supellecticarium]